MYILPLCLSFPSLKYAGFLLSGSGTVRNKANFCGNFIILMANVRSEDVHRKEN